MVFKMLKFLLFCGAFVRSIQFSPQHHKPGQRNATTCAIVCLFVLFVCLFVSLFFHPLSNGCCPMKLGF